MRRNLFLIGYENVALLSPGMSFGEISLLNENHKRTSTIFIDEDSHIGRLNLSEYNSTIKSVRAKMRTDSINFLLSTKLFGEISFSFFLNKYWIYFQCKKNTKRHFIIVGYGNVATLSSGMSFGEISLLNENHKRSSTIFIDD